MLAKKFLTLCIRLLLRTRTFHEPATKKTLPQNVLYGILPYPLYGAFRGIMVQNPHF